MKGQVKQLLPRSAGQPPATLMDPWGLPRDKSRDACPISQGSMSSDGAKPPENQSRSLVLSRGYPEKATGP